jgi:CarD family transcriptional regulator
VKASSKKLAKKAPSKKLESPKKALAKKAPSKKLESAKKGVPAKKAPSKKSESSKKAPAKVPAAKKAAAQVPAAGKPSAKPEPVKKAAVVKEVPAKVLPQVGRRGNAERGAAREEAPPPPKPGKATSRYSVGDKVVHPQHGAATIARRIKREFGGVVRDYYVLDISTESLTVMVPVEKVDHVVRSVISKTQSRNVLASLKEEPQEAGANWSRWYKVLTEKMYSGDIFQVAEVVRDLSFAQQTKGISPALKRMLSKARMTLISELSFSLEEDEEEATKRLDKALPRIETALTAIE